MTKGAALQSFFESFGIPAYSYTSVPEDAAFPYLTYTPVFDSWGSGQAAITVNLWYRTTSEAVPSAKAQEIADAIGGGKYAICDGGAVLLTKGSPWCQSMTDGTDAKIKRRYININAEYITLN